LSSLGRLTAQDGRVWVNQSAVFAISEIDPATGTVSQQVRAGCTDGHVTLNVETLWITDLCDDKVLRVDLDGPQLSTNESEEPMFITSRATTPTITRCATATAIAVALLLTACGGGDDNAAADPSPTLPVATVEPTATTAAVLATPTEAAIAIADTSSDATPIQVGESPCCMAFAAGTVWLVNAGDSTIMRIDPATSEVVATIDLGVPPADLSVGPPSIGIAASGDMVWAYRHGDTSELVQINPADNSLGQPIALDFQPNSLALGADGNLWLTGFGANALFRIDPGSGELMETIEIPGATNMTAGGDSIWVETQGGRNSVARVDASTGEILATLPLDGAAWATGDDTAGWVTDPDNNLVHRIDLESNEIVAEIRVDVPALMAVGDGALWVGSLATGAIYRIDPTTNTAVEIFKVAPPAIGMVVTGDAVWVTDTVNGTVTRIDL
jgi:streptogramin lyase